MKKIIDTYTNLLSSASFERKVLWDSRNNEQRDKLLLYGHLYYIRRVNVSRQVVARLF